MFNPLEEFKIVTKLDFLYKNLDLSISIPYILFILALILLTINIYIIISDKLVINKIYYLIIKFYSLVMKEFYNTLGINNSKYLPFITFTFYYVLIANVLGLIPYSFTLTSQIVITLLWSLTIMISVTWIGIKIHGFKFIHLFIPNGVPTILIPYIMIIELISYTSRIFSLAIRLTANILSGHTLIYIISSFGFKFNFILKVSFILPILLFILTLEIGVAVIQAYVITILLTIYIRDSINLH